ncbi:MAG: leucyl aminopeptidase family protein [Saprospiraceae bacterium]
MKRVYISKHTPDQPVQALVFVSNEASIGDLSGSLLNHEMTFIESALTRHVKHFVFPRPDQVVFVRLLETEENASDALESARRNGHGLLSELKAYHLPALALSGTVDASVLLAFAEGLALSSYAFGKYRTNADEDAHQLAYIGIDAEQVAPEPIEELDSLVETVFFTRDMVNEPQSHFNAIDLAEMARKLAEQYGMGIEILEKEQIETLKMGGLLAINRASSIPPRFCILEWKPERPCNAKPLVLVGKGVMYDTGGLSLKTPEGMETMKCDMAGAGAVMGAMAAAAYNKLGVHVIGLIPATDNMIGERALAPGDIIRMHSGHTVEVVNTDAEGRIILADALHFARKYDPELVLDVATLTGAAVRALGNQAICYMGTASRETKAALESCGWHTYERCVELPLWKEYGEELKSNVADLRNVGNGAAGMITAGKFLEHFAKFPWLHLDIAGPAYLRSANAYRPKDGTGVGVRLLYQFLKLRAQANLQ